MSTATTELNLQVAQGADDTADYLTNKLGGSLQVLDGLFSQPSGHTHSGPHQGGLIKASAFSGAMDIPSWFRSTGQTPSFATTGQGIELYWSGTAGVLQSYDRGANAYRDMLLESDNLKLAIGGNTLLELDSAGQVNLWGAGAKVGSIRPHGTNGFEFLNAADSAVTFTIDGAGNITVPGSATIGGALGVVGNANISGTITTNGITCSTIQTNGNIITCGPLNASGAITSPSHQTSGNVTVQNSASNVVPSTVNGQYEHIEHGFPSCNGVANNAGGMYAQSFSRAFNGTPVVLVSVMSPSNGDIENWHVAAQNISTTGFSIRVYNQSGSGGNCTVAWFAMGN